MTIDFSRRGLMGLAAGTALAGGAARAATAPPLHFGPDAGVAHLLYNENPYGPAPSAIRAMADVARDGWYYIDDIQPRLAAMIAARHGVAPEQVVIGNGSSEVLAATAMAWGAKGAILTADLTFEEFLQYAAPKGVQLVRTPMTPGLGIDLPGMAARTNADVALIHICNPNNPTGLLLDPAQLRDFIRSTRRGTTVLVDEAYNELLDAPASHSVMDLVRQGHDLIVTRTFSKIYGMAGLRVGYAITTPENARRIRAWNMTISLTSASLAAALASYDDQAFLAYSRQKVAQGRKLLTDAVATAGLRCLPSETNFLFVEVPDADALQRAMAARGIMIRGAYGPWKRWSRVSTGLIEHVQRYAAALPELVRG
ncbi:MAG: histidinol phosphate aminotransferase [Alphaproteobacteria bacterium PA4]|nr:MAG: histidinol phosphate aminotransferase [Alphaproteobacteria bacterium PA4]